ncbi:DNA-3-methyladenine glycosylase [Actinomycetaceae bacterium WB03_NA08]|uniref:Putative 3-methyladenine DNA glycosylase n=1 Tax=Scrofimicrobium canadense TaxID=2652290 RepID=A0A6N7W1J6_9ACTO|nr:DNA-3-methyladenine glycosylase [Scrofimicrobium canadense]MSS83261.1 DNA-3-methyladenine glycosylase [Scrofimicrobium canadense]
MPCGKFLVQYVVSLPKPLLRSFYQRDTLQVARSLIGCVLHYGALSGVITETEGYLGPNDDAAHSAKGRTPRTEVLFGPAGYSYVYLIYGMWNCLNVVTEGEGEAVLIRAVEPLSGVDLMRERRGRHPLADGPGKLCQAFGITRTDSGRDITCGDLYISERIEDMPIEATPRIGIDYATRCKDELWRFVGQPTRK